MDKKRLAEMWCELNCWETPKEVKKRLKRELDQDNGEFTGAMAVIESLTTEKERMDEWRRGDGISATRGKK